ncbi:MAG: SPOR domain-containing protein [Salinibacter sp.]|uniref:SPOR domain-containing protein n=1 Tax=Salinibacter sp. TaxID=2065818 RepID=UPI002FC30F05
MSNTSIPPLLAERLDISEERARSLLDTMVEELRERAETDGVQLSGLGTFREEDGRLTFQPSPTLRRRVNRPYEGLSAESLSPSAAPEEADSDAESADSETPPFLTRKSSAEEEDAAPDESGDPEPPSDDQDRPPTRPDADERSVDSFALISLILAGLFLLGAGWFVVNQTSLWGPTENATPSTTAETPPDPTAGSAPADSVPGSQPESSPSATKDSATDSEPTPAVRDWTIVVASSSSRSAAQEAADTYGSRFDSVTVVPGTVDNTTWYRVTIGRYTSETDAERVLDDRADALPSDAWTHQLE